LAAERPRRRNVLASFVGRWDATAAVYTLAIVAFDVALLVPIGTEKSGRVSAAFGITVAVAWLGACLMAGCRKTPWVIRLTAMVLLTMLVVSARVFEGHDAADAWRGMGLVAAVEVVAVLLGRAARRVLIALRSKLRPGKAGEREGR